MKILLRPALAACLAAAAAVPAAAHPVLDATEIRRNGALSRHVWAPEFARTELNGLRVSAGLALGLRGSIQANLDRRVAPAITVHTGDRSQLSVLWAGSRGAMVVWQSP